MSGDPPGPGLVSAILLWLLLLGGVLAVVAAGY